MKVPADVLILPHEKNHWVIYNFFSRTCIGVDYSIFELLSDINTLTQEDLVKKYISRFFFVWEISYFSNYQGLLADPTRYIRNLADWPEPERIDFEQALHKLKNNFIIIDDESYYRSRFAPLTSIVDKAHFGNFHQQLGQELLIVRREMPEDWWLNQKFSDNFQSIRNNLYRAVQANYLENYFPLRILKCASVVDVGCGIGFYSNMMARTGAKILGLDPNKKYIEIARQKATEGTRFEVCNVGVKGALDFILKASIDIVFMSDALLFYFTPENPSQAGNLKILLSEIHRILKPDGVFISMEPHYIFWLLPWLGEIEHPFTILTEYNKKIFGVTTTLSTLLQSLIRGGFVVTWMDEITPEKSFQKIDPRAYHFATEFPLWQIFELKPI